MKRFALKTYGCQMNVYDADTLRTALLRSGWEESDDDSAAVVIYTGCSIRDKAEHKIWSDLGRHAETWKRSGRPVVAVTGCIAQNIGKDILGRFPWVRVVSGPRSIGLLPDALAQALSGGECIDLRDRDARAYHAIGVPPVERENRWKAHVTIAHGCDNFCTYCIVPYVRGRFLSRAPREILDEIRQLVATGVREITLLGQNVNSYGADFSDGYRFSALLRDAASIAGVDRLRFVTSHPKDFTADICDAMDDCATICPSINLPIQSGSDRILALMNRSYTLERYTATIEMIRDRFPDAGVTSDLIVGFPGETEVDFNASVDALRRFRFDLVHTAAYSPRSGTVAATMDGQLPEEEKNRRLNYVNDLQRGIALEINKSLVGKRFSILLDGFAPRGEDTLQGRTDTDKVVLLRGGRGEDLGRFALVEISEADHWCLHGSLIRFLD